MYKLAFSNIAWERAQDEVVYKALYNKGFRGLEIAPSRIFPVRPYDNILEAEKWASRVRNSYGLEVCSIQSIWYGRNESIFGTQEERDALMEYTKKAIEFCCAVGSKNLVFGCPKNRNLRKPDDINIAEDFFVKTGEWALKYGVVVSLEANPRIYHTNFLNKTSEAIDFAKNLNVGGVKVNLDLGTVIENNENIYDIFESVHLINHIHISEPFLEKIIQKNIHEALKQLIVSTGYRGYVSVEMKKMHMLEDVYEVMDYVKSVFA